MATKTFNVSMDEELVRKIDEAAKAQYTSRSDYIRMATLEKLSTKNKKLSAFSGELDEFMDTYQQDLKNLAKR